MQLVDSHCHLDMLKLDVAEVLARAKQNNVAHFLNVCVSLEDFPEVLRIAEQYPNVSASIGLHPNETGEVSVETLIKLGQPQKVVAVGETGLDYYRSTGDLEWQRERFRRHIAAAKALNKPLIIHTRAAKEDTIAIMRDQAVSEIGGVMHCFSEDWEMAKQALDMNFYISFSGVVTFKNAAEIQAVAKKIPLDRMLVETDCPYLAPVPFRGKPNEPAYVRYTAEYIAQMRGVALEEIAHKTTENFFNLFKQAVKHV